MKTKSPTPQPSDRGTDPLEQKTINRSRHQIRTLTTGGNVSIPARPPKSRKADPTPYGDKAD